MNWLTLRNARVSSHHRLGALIGAVFGLTLACGGNEAPQETASGGRGGATSASGGRSGDAGGSGEDECPAQVQPEDIEDLVTVPRLRGVLQQDDEYLYFIDDHVLGRVLKSGAEPEPLYESPGTLASVIAVDENHVYFTTGSYIDGFRLARIPKEGGEADQVEYATGLGRGDLDAGLRGVLRVANADDLLIWAQKEGVEPSPPEQSGVFTLDKSTMTIRRVFGSDETSGYLYTPQVVDGVAYFPSIGNHPAFPYLWAWSLVGTELTQAGFHGFGGDVMIREQRVLTKFNNRVYESMLSATDAPRSVYNGPSNLVLRTSQWQGDDLYMEDWTCGVLLKVSTTSWQDELMLVDPSFGNAFSESAFVVDSTHVYFVNQDGSASKLRRFPR